MANKGAKVDIKSFIANGIVSTLGIISTNKFCTSVLQVAGNDLVTCNQ